VRHCWTSSSLMIWRARHSAPPQCWLLDTLSDTDVESGSTCMPVTQMVCTRCGSVGAPKRYTPGSFGVELLLFLFFIIPGLIYGIWRLTARTWVCRVCLADTLVPLNSRPGNQLPEEPKLPNRLHGLTARPAGGKLKGDSVALVELPRVKLIRDGTERQYA
jgi:hypothetical protein